MISIQLIYLHKKAGNKLGNEGAKYLSECIKENSTLTSINLGLKIYFLHICCLSYSKKNGFTKKGLNQIGVEGIQHLCEGLKKNSSIATLELGFTKYLFRSSTCSSN